MGRKRKHKGKWDRVDLIGATVGGEDTINGCIIADEHDKYGHRYVTVQWFCKPATPFYVIDRNCPACHGEPTRHRWDKIKRGEIKSCGRLKRKLYAEHIRSRTQNPLIDVAGNPIPATARLKRKR